MSKEKITIEVDTVLKTGTVTEIEDILPSPPVYPPTIDLILNKIKIEEGQSAILSWTSSNAVKVTINGIEKPLNGIEVVSPLVGTTVYAGQAIGDISFPPVIDTVNLEVVAVAPPPPATPITAIFTPGRNSDDIYCYPDTVVDGLSLWFGNPSGIEVIDMGIRVVNTILPGSVLIPQGAKILESWFTFQSNSWYDSLPTNMHVRFYGQLITDAPTFDNTIYDFPQYFARKRTVIYKDWDNVPAFLGKVDYDSPDLSPIIQEIVNLPGGCGNSLVLFCVDNGSHQAFRGCYPFNRTPALCPRLTVKWTI